MTSPPGIKRGRTAARTRFAPAVFEAFVRAKIVGIRVGGPGHRFTGVWVVTAGGRVYLRSWKLSNDGWRARFLEEGVATVQAGPKTLRVRGVRVFSERVLTAVDAAYFAKYPTPGSRKYCLGFARGRRRAGTIELRPASAKRG